MLTIYGIKNCSTMKKAFTALDEAGVAYEFFDYKKQEITTDTIQTWVNALGIDTVLNKRGTTWRKQSDETKEAATADESKAVALMAENPSMIKRPMLVGEVAGNAVLMAGFDAEKYVALGA